MTAALEEVVSIATLLAMLEAALRWPLELLEDLVHAARSKHEHWCWLQGFLGFGGTA